MKNNAAVRAGKKKKRRAGLIAVLAAVVIAAAALVGWLQIDKEHKEAAGVPLHMADFSRLRDGVYTGGYQGGMYGWRANSAQVTVQGGRVVSIRLLEESMKYNDTAARDALYDRVVKNQSLQVDVISGATLTSKGYLMAVQNALLQAGG
ncbi:FMN-binding domain-containing protein [Sporobacter termitidis DSM 10068]|uniref:FMN-binding domain-containing protein n=1 Tax=Sporobacter termitidis DSM 10068 TaxID=1123282 RepID=A0A1M5Z1M2_9FIRM|nr:FMN-binding protein [Sporobacter termitidis]SHI18165.1 FMN-binding domain-containing protein [Sporobacter termitidis DSM 10068]